MANVKLGKRPPARNYGAIRVKVADFVDTAKIIAELPAEKSFSWARGLDEPLPVFLNDELPDCTCATQAQDELVQSHRVGSPETPSDEAVLEMFHATGVEQHLTDDDGRYHEGVLSYRKRVGMKQADGSYEKIVGYAAVNWLDRAEVRAAGYLFGGLHVCAALPETAEYQLDYGFDRCIRPRWVLGQRLPDGSRNPGSTAPGSWGGHAFFVTSSIYGGLVALTWGRRVFVSWSWLAHYGDEMYAVVTSDWTRAQAPSGFDRDGLVALLGSLG